MMRRAELIDSIRLSRLCFGELVVIDNEEEILADYADPRRGGTYVLAHEGQLISQIGIFHDQIKMYDGTIRTGSIGGVCTHPDYRKQGLASHLLEHCAAQLVKEGARLMLISGDNGVYMRLGNVFQGKYMYFSMKTEQRSQWQSAPADLQLRRATAADARLCSQLYQAEPVHFVRRHTDFLRAVHKPMSNLYIHADPWIVERAGQALAYLFLGIPWSLQSDPGAGVRHMGEYAGSRSALADAIPTLMAISNINDLTWPVAWQDVELIQLLHERGHTGNIASLEGHTLRIINFPGFVNDLRPILRARLEANLLRGLRFEQSGPLLGGIGDDLYTIVRGSDRLELDGAAMTLLIMGNADTKAKAIHAPSVLAEVISALFPLPSFLPGLNYH
jgi:GNAT superfamily N-acetyltransferase